MSFHFNFSSIPILTPVTQVNKNALINSWYFLDFIFLILSNSFFVKYFFSFLFRWSEQFRDWFWQCRPTRAWRNRLCWTQKIYWQNWKRPIERVFCAKCHTMLLHLHHWIQWSGTGKMCGFLLENLQNHFQRTGI